MMKALFEQIESAGFAAQVTIASGFRVFRRALADNPGIKALLQHLRETPAHRQVVYERLLGLLDANDQPAYLHPYDPALAWYLYVLSMTDYPLAAEAARQILQTPKLWWANKLADDVLTQVQDTALAHWEHEPSRVSLSSHAGTSAYEVPGSQRRPLTTIRYQPRLIAVSEYIGQGKGDVIGYGAGPSVAVDIGRKAS
jgi:hypothetical protein